MTHRAQKGFAALEMILLLVIIGIIAFVAWRIVDANGTVDQTANSVPKSSEVQPSKAAVTPTTSNDLDILSKQLDDTKIDDNTTSDLDTESAF